MILMILDDGVFQLWWTNALCQLYDYIAELRFKARNWWSYGHLLDGIDDSF
jgi:hypothetical protein